MDRPRRALFEEPDNVESYVAKRSLGITQADTGDRIVVRPARATRAIEPGAAGNQTQVAGRDQLGRSHPPTPRRALPAEPLSWDLEAPKASPTEPVAAGRRAIVDLEQTPVGGPIVPSQPTVPLAVRPTALEPRGSHRRDRGTRPGRVAAEGRRATCPRSLRVRSHRRTLFSYLHNRPPRLRFPFHCPPRRSSSSCTGPLCPSIFQHRSHRRHHRLQWCLDRCRKPDMPSRLGHSCRSGRRRLVDQRPDNPSIAPRPRLDIGPDLPAGRSAMRCRQSSWTG